MKVDFFNSILSSPLGLLSLAILWKITSTIAFIFRSRMSYFIKKNWASRLARMVARIPFSWVAWFEPWRLFFGGLSLAIFPIIQKRKSISYSYHQIRTTPSLHPPPPPLPLKNRERKKLENRETLERLSRCIEVA